MSLQHGLKKLWRPDSSLNARTIRLLHYDGRQRLTGFFTPTQTKKQLSLGQPAEDGHDLLQRAGFLRQAHSGIFHLLPLGLRVQDKLERLIDKHMRRLGATKVSLSSISSQDLWHQSGRLEGRNSELFQFQDRKDAKYLLAPTHEEEITTAVKNTVHSYRDLPLRLYQVSRKYRDEARPRQGLLRSREFIMKDLYTFDINEKQAMSTYEDVRASYRGFLDELNIPYLVANADSGNMGGSHSHEYHFMSQRGEDTIISCSQCGLSINEELYVGNFKRGKTDALQTHPGAELDSEVRSDPNVSCQVWYGLVPDPPQRKLDAASNLNADTVGVKNAWQSTAKLLQIFLPPGDFELNTHAIKKLVPGVNTGERLQLSALSQNGSRPPFGGVMSIRDPRVSMEAVVTTSASSPFQMLSDSQDVMEAPFLLTKARSSDPCPNCGIQGSLAFQQAVEIGHTFHLGKRYSTPLEAVVQNEKNELVDMQMGCHGIGLSRILGAAASLLADDRGLNWPISIAPFGVLLLGAGTTPQDDVIAMYDHIAAELSSVTDVVMDDRERPLGWKLNDADLIGYPFIVVLGRAWTQQKAVELQCRRLSIKEEVPYDILAQRLREYSAKL